jgi:hypothetical protein
MPYSETPPFSLTLKLRPPLVFALELSILSPQALQLGLHLGFTHRFPAPIPCIHSFSKLPSPALFDRSCHAALNSRTDAPYFSGIDRFFTVEFIALKSRTFVVKSRTTYQWEIAGGLPGAWRSSKSRSRQPRLATLPSEASRVSPRAHHAERRSMLPPLPSTLSAI